MSDLPPHLPQGDPGRVPFAFRVVEADLPPETGLGYVGVRDGVTVLVIQAGLGRKERRRRIRLLLAQARKPRVLIPVMLAAHQARPFLLRLRHLRMGHTVAVAGGTAGMVAMVAAVAVWPGHTPRPHPAPVPPAVSLPAAQVPGTTHGPHRPARTRPFPAGHGAKGGEVATARALPRASGTPRRPAPQAPAPSAAPSTHPGPLPSVLPSPLPSPSLPLPTPSVPLPSPTATCVTVAGVKICATVGAVP